MLGVGWNVIGGWAGQFDFGPQVFFAVGAYTAALLYVRLGVDAWLGLPVAAAVAALICAVAIWMIAQPIGATWDYIGAAQGLFIPVKARSGVVTSALSLQFAGPTK